MLMSVARKVRSWLLAPLLTAPRPREARQPTQEIQLLLSLQYRQLQRLGAPLPSLEEVGFRVFSESDEDGILHYLFSLLGTSTRTLVDLGASQLHGSNTANLLVNHGWTGLLIDGSEERIDALKAFYRECPDTSNYPPECVASWITAENVNELLESHGQAGSIDLLCIDLDGVDYWIWKALDVVTPRVVVVEYQCVWGPERSVTVPYDPQFKAVFEGKYGVYNSASLAAFVKLGALKGYRLVGCQRYGYNAFFVRNGVGVDAFPAVTPQECFKHPFPRWAMETLLAKVKDLNWIEV
jgi:hypothetical protein